MKLISITLLTTLFFFVSLADRDRDSIDPLKTIPKIVIPNHKWDFTLVHDEKYPEMPYETNGDGPAYRQDDLRLKELNATAEPPHPDMPDEFPKVLLQMEEKLNQAMGIMKPDQPTDSSEVLSEKDIPRSLEFENMGQKEKEDFRMRFMEAKDKEVLQDSAKNKIQIGVKNINTWWNWWTAAPLVSAWASSVYTYRYWWWSHSYPATNAIKGQSYWSSTGGHSKTQVVTFQADLDRYYRINHILIHWAYASGELSIQTSGDGKTWEERIPWRKGARSWLSSWWYRIFWWWSWWYRSYAENIVFDEPVWMQSFRVLMKDPLFYYYGIYKVQAWSHPYVVQFKNGASTDEDDCLSVGNANYNYGQDLVSAKCIDDIANLDARELFVLRPDMMVSSFLGGLCLDVYSSVVSEQSKIALWGCNGQSNQKWLLDPKGAMKTVHNAEWCLSVAGKEVDIQKGATATASHTMNDGQHEPKLAIDGNENDEKYWASSPGYEQVNFVINFPAVTVKKVTIEFHYVACDFDVLGLIDGAWRSFGFITGNTKKEVDIQVGSKTLTGVKIIFSKTNAKFDGKPIYGISEVKINSGAKPVSLRKCTDNNGGQNKWYLDDAHFADPSVPPRLRYEMTILNSYTNRLLDMLNILVTWPPKLVKMIEKGKEMKERIRVLEENLNDFDMKMSVYRAENLQKEEEEAKEALAGTIGSNSIRPGKSCAAIKKTYSYKKTGYYWIQPKCSKVPMRVFCDFTTSKFGLPYAFYGGLGDNNLGKRIQRIDDVRYECAKLGLEPVELYSKDQVDLIHHYLLDIGVNLLGKAVVPLGYDYGCDSGGCAEKYRSLNTPDSKEMTDVFKARKDPKNILAQAWSKLFNVQKDEAIGFGMSKTGMMTFKFKGNIPVKGIICSTNNDDSEFEKDWVSATCDTVARGNPEFDGAINTNIKVKCPAGCLNQGTAKVWGVESFKDDSSICKAAIHNGRYKPEETGFLEVGIENGQKSYKGADSNGIKSEEWSEPWDRSFVVNTYLTKCPIENFKSREQTAFLQLNQFDDNMRFVQDEPSSTGQQNGDAQGDKGEKADKGQQGGQGEGEQGGQGSQAAPQTQSSVETQTAQTTKVETTEDAIKKLEAIFAEDKTALRKQIRIVSDASTLNAKLAEQYQPLLTTDIGPDFQLKYLDSVEMHLLGSLNEMQKLLAEAKEKLRRKIKKKKELMVQKMKLMRFDPYQESYYLDINDVYETQVFRNAFNCPPNWSFTKQNLKTHANAISQTSSCQITGGTNSNDATHLVLKYKRYYDGKIRVSFMGRADGRVGFAFRYIDQFNFYVFDMQRGPGGFKRLRKILNGKSINLAVLKDGGYLEDTWYRIVIVFKQGQFKVYMDEETEANLKPEGEDNMKMVIQGFDGDFAMGGVAFTLNNMNGAYFDHFQVEGIDCTPADDLKENVVYTPPACSRFKESYQGDFKEMWEVADPPEEKDGPSSWKYKDDYLGRNKVIYQGSLIYSGSVDKVPAILGLKINKVCQKGVVQIDFNAKTQGYIAIGFHFLNAKNHYSFEVGGEVVKFCQVRKAISGNFKNILKSEDEKCGYDIGKWYTVTIQMFSKLTVIYMSKEGEGLAEVLRVENDGDFKFGRISLGTFKTQAGFSNIKMLPNEDVDIKIKKDPENKPTVSVDPADPANTDNDDDTEPKGGEVKPNKPSNGGGTFESDNQVKWDLCLNTKTPEDRGKYCVSKFPNSNTAKNDCQNNFCERCCTSLVDELHPGNKFKCMKECQEKETSGNGNQAYLQCSQSTMPAVSVYQYCEVTMGADYDRMRCKIDFCNLCCITSDNVFHQKFDDKSNKSCRKECMENFLDSTDVTI